eukprot:13869930-Alexandrium_andersonii.AAC.1
MADAPREGWTPSTGGSLNPPQGRHPPGSVLSARALERSDPGRRFAAPPWFCVNASWPRGWR